MSVETYYDVLGIPERATQTQIKAAYRHLIKQVHPDTLSSVSPHLRRIAEDNAKDLTDAYSVLSDVSKRCEYDSRLAEYRQQSSPTSPAPRRQSAPQGPTGPYCTRCGMPLTVFAAGGAARATLLCPKCGDIHASTKPQPRIHGWESVLRWACQHLGLVCSTAIASLILFANLLQDLNTPTQSQVNAASASQTSAAVNEHTFTAYPCAKTETVSPIDHKPCKTTAGAESGRDLMAIDNKPAANHAGSHPVSLDAQSSSLAPCGKSGTCKAEDSAPPQSTIPNPVYAIVKSNYARLEKRCAFMAVGNPRHCSFDHTLAELRPGDRVRVVSPRTRAEDGNDIYKIRTEQGWVGWVNSMFLVVEYPGG
jgi:hypothetical protein